MQVPEIKSLDAYSLVQGCTLLAACPANPGRLWPLRRASCARRRLAILLRFAECPAHHPATEFRLITSHEIRFLFTPRLVSAAFAAESRPTRRPFSVRRRPGIRNYLEYGGHGVLVFDLDRGHTFVRRIPAAGRNAEGTPLNVKGVVASAATRRL